VDTRDKPGHDEIDSMFSHTRRVQIEWGHCDPAGIVFNPRYFEYFDWSTALLFERALGMTKPEMLKAYRAAGIPLVDTRAKFLAPCRFGETVEINSSVLRLGRSSFEVEHRVFNGATLAVEGAETRVWTARDEADPARLKAAPIPAEVVTRLSQ
jgi:4-hydroxybenzoyl-CoA thioesterase